MHRYRLEVAAPIVTEAALVREGEMPPWVDGRHPMVITWGERTFAFAEKAQFADDVAPVFVYREVFRWYAEADPSGREPAPGIPAVATSP